MQGLRKKFLTVWYWLIPILNFFDIILMRIPYVIYISWFFYSTVIFILSGTQIIELL